MTTLADRLRELVDKNDTNPHELARRTKLSQPTISRIMSGVIREPKRDTIEQLAAHFGVSPDWLSGTSDQYEDRFTHAEIDLIKKIRRLDKRRSQVIYDMLDMVN